MVHILDLNHRSPTVVRPHCLVMPLRLRSEWFSHGLAWVGCCRRPGVNGQAQDVLVSDCLLVEGRTLPGLLGEGSSLPNSHDELLGNPFWAAEQSVHIQQGSLHSLVLLRDLTWEQTIDVAYLLVSSQKAASA